MSDKHSKQNKAKAEAAEESAEIMDNVPEATEEGESPESIVGIMESNPFAATSI